MLAHRLRIAYYCAPHLVVPTVPPAGVWAGYGPQSLLAPDPLTALVIELVSLLARADHRPAVAPPGMGCGRTCAARPVHDLRTRRPRATDLRATQGLVTGLIEQQLPAEALPPHLRRARNQATADRQDHGPQRARLPQRHGLPLRTHRDSRGKPEQLDVPKPTAACASPALPTTRGQSTSSSLIHR